MEEERIRIEVGAHDNGERLDKFLAYSMAERFSRAFIQRLITKELIRINTLTAKNHHLVKEGDLIEITVPEPALSSITPEKIPLDIVYEDRHLLIVNKARGMVVHPAPGNFSGTLVNALLSHCKNLSGIGGVVKPGIVHRIDKDASGLLVVAKSDKVHKSLSKQFKAKAARRIYITLVRGVVELDNEIIDLPLGRCVYDRKKRAVDMESTKNAITQYKVLERFLDTTLLEVTLGTGRTHQIRVHMSHIGHPIVGDDKYSVRIRETGPLALHAKKLGFTHPVTNKAVEFVCDIPADMKSIIEEKRREFEDAKTGKKARR